MPVLSMNEAAWDKSSVMLPNGHEMSGIRQHTAIRQSQDDATVGYFFQRPQTDVSQQYNSKRWAAGDDSVIEQVRNVQDLERDFHNLGFESREIAPNTKKIWEDDAMHKAAAAAEAKGLFQGANPWAAARDDTWGNSASGEQQQYEHAMSHPMTMMHRRPGSFPGSDPSSVLSPRSSETGALGVNMAEYVLGGSPVGKELDARLRIKAFPQRIPPNLYGRAPPPAVDQPHYSNMGAGGDASKKTGAEKGAKASSPFEGEVKTNEQEVNDGQSNGIIPNGLDDDNAYRAPGSRQNSPTEDDQRVHQQHVMHQQHPHQHHPHLQQQQQQQQQKPDDYIENMGHQMPHQPGLNIDSSQFEPMGIDPMQFDYSNQLGPPSMDSPNFSTMDYNQQLMQRPQQPIAVLTQQQYALAAQQQQQQLGVAPNNTTPFTATAAAPAPYHLLNTGGDPYALGIPIAAAAAGPTAVVPQYYSVQTPWGLYPAAGLLQQGGQGGQQTPQGAMNQQQQQLLQRQGQRPLTPSQGGQDPLGTPTGNLQQPLPGGGGTGNDGVTPFVCLPAGGTAGYQILAPAYYDQNGQLVMGNGRGIGTPVRLVPPTPILVNATGQQDFISGAAAANGLGANALRLLTTQQQQQMQQPVNYSSSSSTQQNAPIDAPYTPTSSLYTPVTSSLFTPISSSLGLTPQPNSYSSTGLGSLSSSATPGAIGSGMSAQRRDSLSGPVDYKQRGIPAQYYGSLTAAGSPAGPLGLVQTGQPLTPPPSLPCSGGTISIGGLGSSNRMYSAAPGAETKYRNGTLSGASNGLFSSSLFPSRMLSKSASLSKEVTGRSRLLEDFRNNRIPNLQLKDLVNHVVEFSQDQHGSRFIQQKLERSTPAEKQMVFSEILTAAYSLMTDVFGNYVIQKFFEFGSQEQKQTLAQRVRGHVLPLALQMYGCRVIQKALESIPPDMQVEIVKELDGHVLKCVKDQNGNHVVQKCIECVDPKHLQFIIDAFQGQVFALSTHPYGCRVIQRILEHCTPAQTAPILDELHSHTERLVQDQYGNYVIQHVLEHGHHENKSKIVNELHGKVLLLSQHKFASNVVEKCVSHSSPPERARLIDEVCSMNDGVHSALYTMMKDQFANYVVQKMIDVAEPQQRKLLMHKIRPHITTLRKYTYGKHILAKLEKYYMKNSADLGPIGMPPNGTLG